MKSVGEAMAIGRTFKEALQKGIRSMEVKRFGFGLDANDNWLNAQRGKPAEWPVPEEKLRRKLAVPSQGRLYYIRYAMKMGWSIDRIHELTKIDKWFLAQMKQLVDFEDELQTRGKEYFDLYWIKGTNGIIDDIIRRAKQWGYSDIQLAHIWNTTPAKIRLLRTQAMVQPVYKLVDTCAAEFEASTPYYYSTYETLYYSLDLKSGKSMPNTK